MKIILNITHPFYINRQSKTIRMGNFPETAKQIEFSDDKYFKIFELLKNPIEKEELIDKLCDKQYFDKNELKNIIDYLLKENIICEVEEISKLFEDNLYNREQLYFYMLSHTNSFNKIKELKNKNILILGTGGIGSNISLLLARSGFINFTLIDCDKIEISNLNRQMAFNYNEIGKSKTETLKNRLKEIVPNAIIKTVNIKVNKEEDVDYYIKNSDFIVCTLDEPVRTIRRLINKVCNKYNKPVLFSGFSEHVGMVGPFIDKTTACLECIDTKDVDELFYSYKHIPSFGPLCNIIASVGASEILNYFIKYKKYNLLGKTLMINMYNYKSNIIKWKKNKKCKICGDEK